MGQKTIPHIAYMLRKNPSEINKKRNNFIQVCSGKPLFELIKNREMNLRILIIPYSLLEVLSCLCFSLLFSASATLTLRVTRHFCLIVLSQPFLFFYCADIFVLCASFLLTVTEFLGEH